MRATTRRPGRLRRPAGAATLLLGPAMALTGATVLTARPVPAATEAHAAGAAGDHPGRLVTTGAARLFVESEGTGPPLVLLPAGPGLDHVYFHPYLSSLAALRTLVYVDPRGCGRSGPDPSPVRSLEPLVADLEGLRSALGYERLDLLGHGLGQAVAALYAGRHPDRVGRLVLLGAAPRATSFLDAPGLRRAAGGPLRDALRAAAADRSLGDDDRMGAELRLLAPLLFHRLTDREFQQAFVARITPSAGERTALAPALGPDSTEADLSGVYGRIGAPVLIVAGRHDPTATVEEAEAARRAIPGARLVILEESGAFPFAEQPVEFLKAVKVFLVASGEGSGSGKTAGAGGGI